MKKEYGPANAGRISAICKLAEWYWLEGYTTIPLVENKRPIIKWSMRHSPTISWKAVEAKFSAQLCGIGILTGQRSDNLEVLDFDLDAIKTISKFSKLPGVGKIIKHLPIVATPGGYHIWYRCDVIAPGNTKLATGLDANGKPKAYIESRSEGGMVVAPGGWIGCHPKRKPYRLISGHFDLPTLLEPDERQILWDAAKTFNEVRKPEKESCECLHHSVPYEGYGIRPGDDFNRRGTWAEILEPLGWTQVGDTHWRHPGKSEGVSAVADDLFYCWSTSVSEVEAETPYKKFPLFTALVCQGDYVVAAAELRRRGYGEQYDPQKFLERVTK